MEKNFKTFLNIANKQSNLGFGLVALLTAGGEQIFSSAVFKCPCNELNFVYGMVFLLVPALALLLLGFILSKKTWKLFTGLCRRPQRGSPRCRWRKLTAACTAFIQVSMYALVAPASWIAVALLNGNYYECAMTGFNVTAYNKLLCGNKSSGCERGLHKLPCRTGISEDRDDVLLRMRAQSQILGWLLIASVMLSNLLLTCVGRCTSPVSYLQLKFWRAYVEEEWNMFDSKTAEHAKELAKRNLESFFSDKTPEEIITPSNNAWEKISSLYKFSTKDHYYSTLHQYAEDKKKTGDEMVRIDSVMSSEPAETHPVLDFVDGGGA
ncbi:calcium homeostasis modulator protein 6-like [Sebastes fasciatus]|uniref:calcium homeostasis modulator protein 6-like n=1 Tax=Sebastes fasciatus TaxID=394691 RepID=UPI003D9F9121